MRKNSLKPHQDIYYEREHYETKIHFVMGKWSLVGYVKAFLSTLSTHLLATCKILLESPSRRYSNQGVEPSRWWPTARSHGLGSSLEPKTSWFLTPQRTKSTSCLWGSCLSLCLWDVCVCERGIALLWRLHQIYKYYWKWFNPHIHCGLIWLRSALEIPEKNSKVLFQTLSFWTMSWSHRNICVFYLIFFITAWA